MKWENNTGHNNTCNKPAILCFAETLVVFEICFYATIFVLKGANLWLQNVSCDAMTTLQQNDKDENFINRMTNNNCNNIDNEYF